jgi:hypothetical protein
MSENIFEGMPDDEAIRTFVQKEFIKDYLAALSVANAIDEAREAGRNVDASEYRITIAGVEFFAVPLDDDVKPPTDELSKRRRS